MAGLIPNTKKIYLCSPDRRPLFVLNGIRTETVDYHALVKGYSDLTFTVDRFIIINGLRIASNGYDDLKPYMYLYLEDIGYFQMQAPSVNNDGNGEYKDIEAYSAEKEFENKDWKGIKINTGESDSIEYLYSDNLNNLGFAKRYVVMYDENDTRFSFLHMVLEKVSYWSIGHVDYSVRSLKIPSLDINNENLYAVMTSEVAPRLQCLFVFDFLNFEINVYNKDNIDYDTGIFIGYRNLAKTVDINVDQDSVYTRFTVAGAEDLNVRYYNYGDDQIYNIDYFLGEPYMSEELALKIKDFNAFKDEHRNAYVEIAKQTVALRDKLYELKYTVPSDDLYWKNWDSMNEEGLRENLKYYNSFLESLLIAADERPNEEKFIDYEGPNEQYLPILNEDGEVDHEYYLQVLYDNLGKYSGYYTYKEIYEYIIPYIELALENMGKLDEDKQEPEDAGIGVATENWELYGYEELEGVRKSYEEDLKSKLYRYSKKWEDLTPEEIAEYNLNYGSEEEYEATYLRKQYLHLQECLSDKDNPLEGTIYKRLQDLQELMDDVQQLLDVLNKTLSDYNNLMKYDITTTEHYEDSSGEEVPYDKIEQSIVDRRQELLFSDDEIDLITTLFHDTDYTNSNILTTSIDTEYLIIDREKELYDDATEKLVEVSQPQYTFSVSLDNLLRISDYKNWYGDFKLLRFIWLGIRDDYSVKLRIIGYRWNPCEITPDLQLEFSNMITSKSGRSDLVLLLELENNRGSKNSISIGTGKSRSDSEYVASLVGVLARNSVFTKSVQNIVGVVAADVDSALVQNIVSDYISTMHLTADSINVGNITGTDGQFESLITKYLKSDVIYTKLIDAEQGRIRDLAADVIKIGSETDENGDNSFTQIIGGYIDTHKIVADDINVDEALVNEILTIGTNTITQIAGGLITTEKVIAELIKATDAQLDNLSAKVITVGESAITTIAEGVITTAKINADNINVTEAFVSDVLRVGTTGITSIVNDTLTTETVVAKLVDADAVQAREVSAAIVTADAIVAGLVDAEEGIFDDLTADNAFIEYLQANLITASEIRVDDLKAKLATIDVASIKDLSADNAFINSLLALASTSATSVIDDAYIYNAVANKITVSDLAAGNIILSDAMQIQSDNGKMIMNGKTLQIKGTDSNEREFTAIQLGYDAEENPSFIINSENGTALFTSTGISIVDKNNNVLFNAGEGVTAKAIADELIVNNMIKDGTISEGKLGFSIMKEGSRVSIEQVYLGDQQFGAEWTTFTQGTSDALDSLSDGIDTINSQKMYRTVIESDNGNIFKNGDVNCTLRCRVYSWDDEITDDINAVNFTWTRKSRNTTDDTRWNTNHSGGRKSLTLTPADVWGRSVFYCTVTLPDGSSITTS